MKHLSCPFQNKRARSTWLPLGACGLLLLTGCAAPHRLVYRTVESPAMHGRSMTYAVYPPPKWDGSERLPLVVFLHGGGDDVDCLDDANIGQLLDEAVTSGRAPKAVIVVPQGDKGFWANWADGTRRYEDWVIAEVMPRVAADYRTLPCPSGCHVAGISMGGNGALRMAFHHPELFSSITCISGPVFDTQRMIDFMNNWFFKFVAQIHRVFGNSRDRSRIEQEDLFLRWQRPEDLKGLRLFLAWGTKDKEGILQTNHAFCEHLDRHGIPYRKLVFPGGHNWSSWRNVFVPMLRFTAGLE